MTKEGREKKKQITTKPFPTTNREKEKEIKQKTCISSPALEGAQPEHNQQTTYQ